MKTVGTKSNGNLSENTSNKEAFSTLRHDIKNSLTIMKCNLDLLTMGQGTKDDPQIGKFIKVINKEIDRVNNRLSKFQ